MKTNNLSIAALAEGVLEAVKAEELSKEAEVAYNRDMIKVSTDLGNLMVKLASELRTLADGPKITYNDLLEYRKRHGI